MTDDRLIDHHCHGVIRRDVGRTGFELLLTEAGTAGTGGPLGGSVFDSQLGFAVRRWCAPLLDLDPHAAPDAYLERRNELGHVEVTERMLRAAGLEALCVDTGFEPEPLLSPPELGRSADASAYEIIRLEQIAEQVAQQIIEGGGSAATFADDVRSRLAERARDAVAVKSIAAYRHGLDLSGKRPTDAEVAAAADRWLTELSRQRQRRRNTDTDTDTDTMISRTDKSADVPLAPPPSTTTTRLANDTGDEFPVPPSTATTIRRADKTAEVPLASAPAPSSIRLMDETLHRFLIWCGVDLGLPVQFHVGYGDADVDLDRCDPLLLTRLLRALEPTGVPVMLLHNYPFHRHAGYLAQVYSNVFIDVGLATHNLGRGSKTLIAEALELAPFGKVLYSSDAFALPELHYLGALLFRRGLADFLRAGVEDDAWTAGDADRVTRMISAENARRVYRLDTRTCALVLPVG